MIPIYETKHEALAVILEQEKVYDNWPAKKVTPESLLRVISKSAYSLKEELAVSHQTVANLLKKLWPNRTTSVKICSYLLHKYGLKACTTCLKVFNEQEFYSNSTKTYGRETYCNLCFNNLVRVSRRSYQSTKRSDKLLRIPKWANLDKIKDFYSSCPLGYHVDHVIPLQGLLVSGLHVENNLQYLLAKDNIAKSNKFTPE